MTLRLIPPVHRATHRIGLHIERLGGAGVTQAEAHILAHLSETGEATIGDVHRAFAHKRSTLTSILDRLERRGLVQRVSDARDRRTFIIRLTRPGRRLARRVSAHLEALERRVLARVPARDVRAFTSVLEALERTSDEE